MGIQNKRKKAPEPKKSNAKLLIVCAACAVAAIALAVVLVIISKQPEKIIYDRESGTYTNEKTGIKYYPIAGLEPVKREKDATAVIVNGKNKTKLYGIAELDPEEWLTDADGTVYRAESGDFELSSLKADRIDFCVEKKTITSVAQINDKAQVWAVLDKYLNGETITDIPSAAPDKTYVLRVSLTDEYEGLFYTIKYVEYLSDITDAENSRYLLKSVFNDRIVVVDRTSDVGVILHEMVK